jgi:hypothetical protein
MQRKLITIAKKLEKASKAHAGQAKTLRKLVEGKNK